MSGTLFVVATPIGNLEDLTFRALRVLGEVDLIAAEDTRRTSRLLAHYEIAKPLVSLHEHNERREAPRLVERLRAGESVALVSDAGTPAISDPGSWLVRLSREAGIVVTPIPGPSAITAALSVSGLSATPFTFLGFPPSSGKARETWISEVAGIQATAVFFESPHRIERTLADLSAEVKRPIQIYRELSKIHEELVEWPITGETPLQPRGEFVLVVAPQDREDSTDADGEAVLMLFDQITAAVDLDEADVHAAVAAIHRIPPARVRRLIKEARIARKRRGPA